jgi:hypothetical protein
MLLLIGLAPVPVHFPLARDLRNLDFQADNMPECSLRKAAGASPIFQGTSRCYSKRCVSRATTLRTVC